MSRLPPISTPTPHSFPTRRSADLRTGIAGLGQVLQYHRDEISMMPGVDEVSRVSKPYKLSSRETHPEDTVIELAHGVKIGGGHPVCMAGPCSIETEEQL